MHTSPSGALGDLDCFIPLLPHPPAPTAQPANFPVQYLSCEEGQTASRHGATGCNEDHLAEFFMTHRIIIDQCLHSSASLCKCCLCFGNNFYLYYLSTHGFKTGSRRVQDWTQYAKSTELGTFGSIVSNLEPVLRKSTSIKYVTEVTLEKSSGISAVSTGSAVKSALGTTLHANPYHHSFQCALVSSY